MTIEIIGFVWGKDSASHEREVRELAEMAGAQVVQLFNQRDAGRRSKWGQLKAAIKATKERSNAYLVVSTLDGKRIGLNRNVPFLTLLSQSGVNVVICDALRGVLDPETREDFDRDPLRYFRFFAGAGAIACQKALTIAETWAAEESERRKNEMAERMKSGWKPTLTEEAVKAARKATSKAAKDAYEDISPLIVKWSNEGLSMRAISEKLNQSGHRTRQGKEFSHVQVMRILKRLQKGG